jgi:hypothetical protein
MATGLKREDIIELPLVLAVAVLEYVSIRVNKLHQQPAAALGRQYNLTYCIMVSEIADGARTPGETVIMDVDAILDRPVARPSLHPELLNSHFGSEAGSLPRASSVPLAPPTYTVGYVYDAAMMSHSPDEGDEHPEQPQRIVAVHNMLLKHGCLSAMKRLPFCRVQREAVLLVHTEQHWRMVLALKSTWHQYFLLIQMR